MDREYKTHESYGMISVGKTSGGSDVLFGSSIPVNNKISIEISHADYERSLNTDRYFPSKKIIEVELSPVQFAEMISTGMNTTGVPCTIRYSDGKYLDRPDFLNKRMEFENEFEQKMKKITDGFNKSINEIKDMLEQKKAPTKSDKESIINLLNHIEMEIRSNVPFMSSCFNEQMDKTVSECKGEVDAFIQNKIISYGLEALKDEMLKLGNIETDVTE